MGANANLCELSADSKSRLTQAGIGDGQDLKHTVHYTNYVLFGTPLRQMYGKNVHRLREIGKQYDPHRIMEVHRMGSPSRRSRYLRICNGEIRVDVMTRREKRARDL
ncbi:hypothetical protein V8E52_010302 [Russula decolorans]|jgi:hypothetical protein